MEESPEREVGEAAAPMESVEGMGAGFDREWSPGELVGKYEIVRTLGNGGMARVYEARHKDLGQRVAIKTLLPQHMDSAEHRVRFLREGRAAAKVRHPHVVQVFDVDTYDEAPYLVMEYLDGTNLEQHIQTYGALSASEASELLLPVCAAVQVAHDRGVIHRDLKPSNVMLTVDANGRLSPLVVDFGIARAVENSTENLLTGTQQILGTPAYLSPEQTRGAGETTEASDQYALGVILYECVVGRPAFNAPAIFAVLTDVALSRFDPPRAVRPDLPESFEAVILRAMSSEPADRFPRVLDFGRALLPFASPRVAAQWHDVFDPEGAPTEARPSWAMSPTQPTVMAPPDPDATGFSIDEPTRANEVPVSPAPVERWADRAPPRTTISGSAIERAVPAAPAAAPRASSKRWIVAAAAALLVAASLGGAWTLRAREFSAEVTTQPADAVIEVDGQTVGRGRWSARFNRDGRVHRMVVRAAGYRAEEREFVNTAPEARLVLERELPTARSTAAPVTVLPPEPVAPQAHAPVVATSQEAAPPREPGATPHRRATHRDPAHPRRERTRRGANDAPNL